jgi:hypothetical protein
MVPDTEVGGLIGSGSKKDLEHMFSLYCKSLDAALFMYRYYTKFVFTLTWPSEPVRISE